MNKKLASPLIFKLGLVGGCELHFRIDQDKTGCVTVTTELLRNGRPVTEREADYWREIIPAATAIMVKGLASAVGKEKLATQMAEWLKEYQKASSMRRSLMPSPREEGIRFYKSWRRHILAAQESGQKISDSDQIKILSPLLAAFSELNAEFVRGIAEAMQILSKRIYKSKDGSGEYLDRWLLDYELRLPPDSRGEHTPEEVKKLISKFSSITEKKLHEKMHKLGIRHKDKPRGKASPNYGFAKGWAELQARLNRE